MPERLRQQAEHRAHQHRLAGPGRTDEAEDLAAIDIEIQLVEHDLVAEADGHVARRQHDIRRRLSSFAGLDVRCLVHAPSLEIDRRIEHGKKRRP